MITVVLILLALALVPFAMFGIAMLWRFRGLIGKLLAGATAVVVVCGVGIIALSWWNTSSPNAARRAVASGWVDGTASNQEEGLYYVQHCRTVTNYDANFRPVEEESCFYSKKNRMYYNAAKAALQEKEL